MTSSPDPELQKRTSRRFLIGALVEAPFITGGVLAYLLTDNFTWIVVGAGLGIGLFIWLALLPTLRDQARSKQGAGSIVE